MPAPVLQFKRGAFANLPGLRAGEPGFTTDKYDLYVGLTSNTTTNQFFGSGRYWVREDGTNSLRLKLVDKDGINGIKLRAPNTVSTGSTDTYVLPNTDTIIDGYFLKVATDGTLSWATGGGSNGTFSNPSLTGITTISGVSLDVNVNTNFSGITTFSNTEDNTLGNPDTGAVQIDGGLGVNKNVTVGAGLSVAGTSYFIGTCTFAGGTINIGDSDTDDIIIAGEFASSLIPSTDETYNIGTGAKRWRNASFAGIGTFSEGLIANNVRLGITSNSTLDTNSGPLYLGSTAGNVIVNQHLDVVGDLDVTGNVYIGGTTVTLRGQDVIIENRDILLGVTTAFPPNDTTANHGGIAIASTEGSPLASFTAVGINTFPDTYKQMMWIRSGTLGFSTDAFAFNYGVAVGTTSMANGVRLAVGSGVTVSDTSVSATTFYGALSGNASSADQVKTVTASNTNATYHLTFVDSHNGSATNETVYTDDGIYYNPGTNTFTTQYGYFTGNVTVDGTITGTATTATRATTVDTTATSTNADYYVPFVDTFGGQNGETIRVGLGLSVNPSNGEVKTSGKLSVGNPGDLTSYIKAGGGSDAMYLYGNGDVSFQQKVIVGGLRSSTNSNNTLTLNDLDASFARNLTIAGITTIGTGVGVTQFSGSVSTGTSESSVPTSKAVIDYITNQVGSLDLTLDIAAGTNGSGTGSVTTGQTLTFNGTLDEIDVTVSGQSVTYGLPSTVVVGTALSVPTIKTATVQHSNGTQAATIDTSGNITASQNLTVSGNLYVNGSTTQVNTAALTVEDRTVELGVVNGAAPSSATTWDLGVLFNYYTDAAKKSAVIWEHGASRFKFASVLGADTDGTDVNTPQLSVTTFAPIEIGALWVTDCAGTSQVISCTGSERFLENITVDAGTF